MNRRDIDASLVLLNTLVDVLRRALEADAIAPSPELQQLLNEYDELVAACTPVPFVITVEDE